jgi:hypothetical protein
MVLLICVVFYEDIRTLICKLLRQIVGFVVSDEWEGILKE